MRSAARNIGVSPATLSRVENGKPPDLSTFERLCRWLGRNPTEFLDVDDQTTHGPTSTVTTATAHLQAKAAVTPELAHALGELILRVQAMFPDDPERHRGE